MPTTSRKKKKLRKQGASVNRTLLLDTVMTSSTDPEHLAQATRGPHRNYSRSRMYKLANVIAALGGPAGRGVNHRKANSSDTAAARAQLR